MDSQLNSNQTTNHSAPAEYWDPHTLALQTVTPANQSNHYLMDIYVRESLWRSEALQLRQENCTLVHAWTDENYQKAELRSRLDEADHVLRVAITQKDNATAAVGNLTKNLVRANVALKAAKKDQDAAWAAIDRIEEVWTSVLEGQEEPASLEEPDSIDSARWATRQLRLELRMKEAQILYYQSVLGHRRVVQEVDSTIADVLLTLREGEKAIAAKQDPDEKNEGTHMETEELEDDNSDSESSSGGSTYSV